MNAMKGEDQEINRATEGVGAALNDELEEVFYGAFAETMLKGAIPKEELGYTPEKIVGIYGQAYSLYNTGNYKDAAQLFRLLVVLDPAEFKYMFALASCFHMMKEYMNAVKVYTVCGLLDPQNPIPQFHASDCYIQMRDRISALIVLELAIKYAGNKPEYQVLKDRALMTMSGIKKELEKTNSATEQGS